MKCINYSYNLLQGKSLLDNNTYNVDPIFSQTKNISNYKLFIEDLLKSANNDKLSKVYNKISSKLYLSTKLVSKLQNNLFYTFNNGYVVVHLDSNQSSEQQLKQIFGGYFSYKLVQQLKNIESFYTSIAILFARYIVKFSPRPIVVDDVLPTIVRQILMWYLKTNGNLTTKNFISITEQAGYSFINKDEVEEFLDRFTVKNFNDLEKNISSVLHVDFSQLLVRLINNLSLQFVLGLECPINSLYMGVIAYYLQFPDNLYLNLSTQTNFKDTIVSLKTLL